MQSKLLADENIPWPLVKLLRDMGIDVVWICETGYRGISDSEVITLANRDRRVVLTRDRDFLKPSLRRRARHGIIYVGEPIKKDIIEKLARNVVRALEEIEVRKRALLAIVTSDTIELYRSTS